MLAIIPSTKYKSVRKKHPFCLLAFMAKIMPDRHKRHFWATVQDFLQLLKHRETEIFLHFYLNFIKSSRGKRSHGLNKNLERDQPEFMLEIMKYFTFRINVRKQQLIYISTKTPRHPWIIRIVYMFG